jgi:hypothetical protein
MLGSTRLHRAARRGVLTAALLAGTVAVAPAGASTVTVPGCFGVGVIVCDPTLDYELPYRVTTTHTTIPVCAGTCTEVPLDVPGVAAQPSHVCVTTEDRAGNQTLNTCAPASTPRLIRCSGSTGYYVVDGDGNELLNACVDTVETPSLGLGRCTGYVGNLAYNGYRVYDRNTGQTWIDGCTNIDVQS